MSQKITSIIGDINWSQKKYVENSANLRYPAKNDRFLAGERR